MTFEEAVNFYVKRRRSEGAQFISSYEILRSLSRFCGTMQLAELSSTHIHSFLNRSTKSPATEASVRSAIRCFIDFYVARRLITALPVQATSTTRSRRLPHIFTRKEIADLVEQAGKRECPQDSFDGATLRMILLTLYATGAAIPEVLTLKQSDVDLDRGRITFCGMFRRTTRTIPIGSDLKKELQVFQARLGTRSHLSDFMFSSKKGEPITRSTLWYRFESVQHSVGIPLSAAGKTARVQDLKFTFAVHRLSNAVRAGEDLNRIIPALSTYMGYSNLAKAEEYLAYVPERFAQDLFRLNADSAECMSH